MAESSLLAYVNTFEFQKYPLPDLEDATRAKAAYEMVVKDLMGCAEEKAFKGYDDERRNSFLLVVEMAIRLAWNCSKSYEGAEGFRSMMQTKFIDALRDAIRLNPFLFERLIREEVTKAKKAKRTSRSQTKNKP